MTEDNQGHVRASEEKVLMEMSVDDFFIKLLIFKERLEKRKNLTTNGKAGS
jgi:hypothetical protein